jgi:hypothetical protein
MDIVPITLAEANEFVAQNHRHHKPCIGHKFSIGVEHEGRIVGVAIVGRPVSRHLDNGWTLEVNRCCTDGTKNACSILYSSAWRAVKGMGYKRLITYILNSETGVTLKASNWKCLGEAGGGSWDRKSRARVDTAPLQKKLLWEAV